MIDKAKELLSHTTVTVGAPVTGGGIGIISLFESIVPVLTVLSIVTGITLGILSYRLKRKVIMKQLEQLEKNGKDTTD